jgi:hypothetical protein
VIISTAAIRRWSFWGSPTLVYGTNIDRSYCGLSEEAASARVEDPTAAAPGKMNG